MAFKISLAQAAQHDISEAVEYIAADSPARAQKWFDDLFLALEGLRENPNRHALIPETQALRRELRSIHHHSHRVVYEVNESQLTVYIVRIYHSARRSLTARDVR